jgi:hypothetical protein
VLGEKNLSGSKKLNIGKVGLVGKIVNTLFPIVFFVERPAYRDFVLPTIWKNIQFW